MAQEVFNVGDVAKFNGKEGVVMDSVENADGTDEVLYVFDPNDPDNWFDATASKSRKVPFNAATPRSQAAAQLAKLINDLPWRK